MIESWRSVVGHEGAYEVSDLGRVRSLPGGRRRGVVLRPHSASGGRYLAVDLCVEGRVARRYVHQLVAAAFIGPRPDGLDVCHANGDSFDNRPSNLRYDTVTANNRDTTRHGRNPRAKRTHCQAGHEFTPDNTYVQTRPAADGSRKHVRVCRACAADSRRAYHQRKRLQAA